MLARKYMVSQNMKIAFCETAFWSNKNLTHVYCSKEAKFCLIAFVHIGNCKMKNSADESNLVMTSRKKRCHVLIIDFAITFSLS